MKIVSIILGVGLMGAALSAHEGHDHGAGAIQSKGVIHKGKKFGIEVLQEGTELQLYPLQADSKPLSKAAKVSGTFELKGKSSPLSLTSQGDYYAARLDFKGMHRMAIKVKVEFGGQSEEIGFNVEPQE